MKTYQNPQPYAVDRVSKLKDKPNNLEGSKHKKGIGTLDQKTSKEIFKRESEEQAWKDVLEKHGITFQ
ncbi:Uncharacterised protein [Legionella lansingensis]|uniref:Uncharacterized protein n=1 Tax=Legionella lansingensis TaxID=45067 RepID=A0A0W0VEG7_9GAMM|nr:hypothetical protein [Legionella lansingensis]KTD18533.1 hypothetical protein Llan_2520 [Legionella lansingensis]SNV50950.1 Uncharacterised protein [Legionella lansingensis]